MGQIRLLAITVLLSLLIWVVADHSLTETVMLQVQIRLEPTGDDMRVDRVAPDSNFVEVQVSGNRTIVRELQDRAPLPVTVKVSPRKSGPYMLMLLDELTDQDNELSQVIVQNVTPPTMEVTVDREQSIVMPIYVLPGTLEYDVQPQVTPEQVEVTISEMSLKNLAPEDRRVMLDAEEYLRTAKRGEPLSVRVPLKPVVGGTNVELNPSFVTLNVQLREQFDATTIPAVPIKIEASMDIFNGFNIEVRGAGAVLTRPLRVKGPPEVLDRLRTGQVKVTGVVVLTATDKDDPGQYRYATPRFNLPPDVRLVNEVEPIEFRLLPRPEANRLPL